MQPEAHVKTPSSPRNGRLAFRRWDSDSLLQNTEPNRSGFFDSLSRTGTIHRSNRKGETNQASVANIPSGLRSESLVGSQQLSIPLTATSSGSGSHEHCALTVHPGPSKLLLLSRPQCPSFGKCCKGQALQHNQIAKGIKIAAEKSRSKGSMPASQRQSPKSTHSYKCSPEYRELLLWMHLVTIVTVYTSQLESWGNVMHQSPRQMDISQQQEQKKNQPAGKKRLHSSKYRITGQGYQLKFCCAYRR